MKTKPAMLTIASRQPRGIGSTRPSSRVPPSRIDAKTIPAKIKNVTVRVIPDMTTLVLEMRRGTVNLEINQIPFENVDEFEKDPKHQVVKKPGSVWQYLAFNLKDPTLSKVEVRRAIAHAIDRERIIRDLLRGHGVIADTMFGEGHWARATGLPTYAYDPAKAKQLLQEAGYKNEPIVFKYSSGNAYVNQYAQVIQSSLTDVGINVQIETLEVNTIRTQLAQGQFQMYTGIWIGGNQDPIFIRDLFATSKIPGGTVACCNRSRYSNTRLDDVLKAAVDETDREASKALYLKAWELVSNDLPLFPLWYPANLVVANKRIGNIKISGSGDWSFLKEITVQ